MEQPNQVNTVDEATNNKLFSIEHENFEKEAGKLWTELYGTPRPYSFLEWCFKYFNSKLSTDIVDEDELDRQMINKVTNSIGSNITAGILPLSEMVVKLFLEYKAALQTKGEEIDLENYCSTAFWAGFANGSLSLDRAMEVHDEWINENVKPLFKKE